MISWVSAEHLLWIGGSETNAVILDTAGKMTADRSDASARLWVHLLKLLRKCKKRDPISGIFLIVSAENLLKYERNEITEKAEQIRERIDEMQDLLDLRLPVYIVVTKADLIVGFREFFKGKIKTEFQDQMIGWTDEECAGSSFDPCTVTELLSPLVKRVTRWRFSLLRRTFLSPSDDSGGRAKSLNRTAHLFAFPEHLGVVIRNLQIYLENILPHGAALEQRLAKPLFVRGIYFTSSLQEGSVLDQAVDQLVGRSASQTMDSDSKSTRHDVTFFLHDIFKKKAFREKYLVTRASDINYDRRKRQIGVCSALILGILALGIWSYTEKSELDRRIGHYYQAFTHIDVDRWVPRIDGGSAWKYWSPLFVAENNGKSLAYRGRHPDSSEPTLESLNRAWKQSTSEIEIPPIFGFSPVPNEDLNDLMQDASQVLIESAVLRPLLDGTRIQIESVADDDWSADGDWARVLRELIKIETYLFSHGEHPSVPIFDFVLVAQSVLKANGSEIPLDERDQIAGIVKEMYSREWKWNPSRISARLTSPDAADLFRSAITAYINKNHSPQSLRAALNLEIQCRSLSNEIRDEFADFQDDAGARANFESEMKEMEEFVTDKLSAIFESGQPYDSDQFTETFAQICKRLGTFKQDTVDRHERLSELELRFKDLDEAFTQIAPVNEAASTEINTSDATHYEIQIKDCFKRLGLPDRTLVNIPGTEKSKQNRFLIAVEEIIKQEFNEFDDKQIIAENDTRILISDIGGRLKKIDDNITIVAEMWKRVEPKYEISCFLTRSLSTPDVEDLIQPIASEIEPTEEIDGDARFSSIPAHFDPRIVALSLRRWKEVGGIIEDRNNELPNRSSLRRLYDHEYLRISAFIKQKYLSFWNQHRRQDAAVEEYHLPDVPFTDSPGLNVVKDVYPHDIVDRLSAIRTGYAASDDEELKTSLRAAYIETANSFFQVWTKDVFDRLGTQSTSWHNLLDHVGERESAIKMNEALESFFVAIKKVTEMVDRQIQKDADMLGLDQEILRDERVLELMKNSKNLPSDDWRSSCERILRHWHELRTDDEDGDGRGARITIAKLESGKAKVDYFELLTTNPNNLFELYWSNVTRSLMNALAMAAQDYALKTYSALMEKCKFPLVFERPLVDGEPVEASLADVEEVKKMMLHYDARLLQSAKETDPFPEAEVLSQLYRDIMIPDLKDSDKETAIDGLSRILRAIEHGSQWHLRFGKVIRDSSKEEASDSWTRYAIVEDDGRSLREQLDDAKALEIETARLRRKSICSLKFPASKPLILFVFRELADHGEPIKFVKIDSMWPAFLLMQKGSNDDPPYSWELFDHDATGKKWTIELSYYEEKVVKTKQRWRRRRNSSKEDNRPTKKQYHPPKMLRLDLELEGDGPGLPDRDRWPRQSNLGG